MNRRVTVVAVPLSLEGERIRTDLETVGHSFIEHSIPTDKIDDAIAAYTNFTDSHPDPDLETMENMIANSAELDDIERQLNPLPWNKYHTNYPEFAKPGGYTNRSLQTAALRAAGRMVLNKKTGLLEEPKDDPKEYYHFHPNSTVQMNHQHTTMGWGPLPPEVHDLHKALMPIHKAGVQVIRQAYRALEETHPELLPTHFGLEDVQASPLRVLFYHPVERSEPTAEADSSLAGGHYDKAMFTAALAESQPGLWIRDPQTGLVRRSVGTAVVFPGRQFKKVAYPNSFATPGWHGVTDKSELDPNGQQYSDKVARWAIIFFANSLAAGTVADKTATHTQIVSITSGPSSLL